MSRTYPVTETVVWQARPPHSDWRRIFPEHLDDYRAKGWEVRPMPDDLAQTPADTHDATYLRGWNEGVERVAELIESGAGMADLIDQDDLDEQAKMIRALSDTSTDRRLPRDLIDREPNHGQYAPDRADVSARWEARPPHSDWRMIAPEHVDDYRAKDWEVRLAPSPIHEDK